EIVVLLDGQGSDEYFGGYDEYFTIYVLSLLRKGKFRKAVNVMKQRALLQKTSAAFQWKVFARSTIWYPSIRQFKKILGRSHTPWLSESMRSIEKESVTDFDACDIQQLSLHQLISTSLPYQLHSADRNSMAFSLE